MRPTCHWPDSHQPHIKLHSSSTWPGLPPTALSPDWSLDLIPNEPILAVSPQAVVVAEGEDMFLFAEESSFGEEQVAGAGSIAQGCPYHEFSPLPAFPA